MNRTEQQVNRAFLELVVAFEKFRTTYEMALVEGQWSVAEPQPQAPPVQPPQQTRLLTRRQAAEYLGVRPQTLATWQTTGRYLLPIVKVGRTVRYRLSDLERWLASRTQVSPLSD